MFYSSHQYIASNVQAEFGYAFYFVLDYFTKLAIFRILPKYDRFSYE